MNPADNHKQDTAAPDEALRIVGIDAPRGRAAQVKATSGHSRGDGPTAMLHLVDIATVAKCLGVNVRHVRRLVAERQIPFIKWRHLLRFDLEVIARWVDQNRHGEERIGTSQPRRMN